MLLVALFAASAFFWWRQRVDDSREVTDARLPFRVEGELAHPLIGKVPHVYESFETGVEVGAGWFSLAPDER